MGGREEVMLPKFRRFHNRQKFLIIDTVIESWSLKEARVISHSIKLLSVRMRLTKNGGNHII
jgi:hypothetical protein